MKFILLFVSLVLCGVTSITHAQPASHVRVYAVALANDSSGAFLGASSKGSGLYQSDDSGSVWTHLGWENVKSYSMDLVQASNGQILYLATGLGVLRSTDFGQTWSQLTDWRVSEVMDIAVNQASPNELWIATPHGPWQSLDTGKSWQKHTEGMKHTYCSRIQYDTSDFRSLLIAAEDGAYIRHLSQGAKRKNASWKRVTNIDRPIRAIAQYKGGWNVEGDGISARVAHDSVTILKHRDVVRWTLSIEPTLSDPFFIFGGPDGADWHRGAIGHTFPVKDVASSALIAPQILLGTLGKGVYRSRTNDFALDGRQIWTLRTALITQ
jgi:hypothetical protein